MNRFASPWWIRPLLAFVGAGAGAVCWGLLVSYLPVPDGIDAAVSFLGGVVIGAVIIGRFASPP